MTIVISEVETALGVLEDYDMLEEADELRRRAYTREAVDDGDQR